MDKIAELKQQYVGKLKQRYAGIQDDVGKIASEFRKTHSDREFMQQLNPCGVKSERDLVYMGSYRELLEQKGFIPEQVKLILSGELETPGIKLPVGGKTYKLPVVFRDDEPGLFRYDYFIDEAAGKVYMPKEALRYYT